MLGALKIHLRANSPSDNLPKRKRESGIKKTPWEKERGEKEIEMRGSVEKESEKERERTEKELEQNRKSGN